jgi:beta-lactamase class A
MMTRRGFLAVTGAAAVLGGKGFAATGPDAAVLAAELRRIEVASGGRLGVAMLDTETGFRVAHRGDERFAMCSTFKLLAASAILQRVDAGRETLSRRIRFTSGDVIAYSPVTKPQAGEAGMTLAELCQAALNYSDNTAANLLLKALGGPAGVTRFARSVGDDVTRLDRWEPSLNDAVPGDPRDTTSPDAMLRTLDGLCLGSALAPASRDLLQAWLQNCKTGDARLKAGIPADWRIGDKTGTGGHGSTNDIGLIWRPGRRPVIVTAYLTNTRAAAAQREATLASVARAVARAVG